MYGEFSFKFSQNVTTPTFIFELFRFVTSCPDPTAVQMNVTVLLFAIRLYIALSHCDACGAIHVMW